MKFSLVCWKPHTSLTNVVNLSRSVLVQPVRSACRADVAIAGNGLRTIIVETANRFARDLMVQEVGHTRLKEQEH